MTDDRLKELRAMLDHPRNFAILPGMLEECLDEIDRLRRGIHDVSNVLAMLHSLQDGMSLLKYAKWGQVMSDVERVMKKWEDVQ